MVCLIWADVAGSGQDFAVGRAAERKAVGMKLAENGMVQRAALAVSGDARMARLLNKVRPFRIYDGPTETHLRSIGQLEVRRASAS